MSEDAKELKNLTVTFEPKLVQLIAELCDLGLKSKGMQLLQPIADLSAVMKKAVEDQLKEDN